MERFVQHNCTCTVEENRFRINNAWAKKVFLKLKEIFTHDCFHFFCIWQCKIKEEEWKPVYHNTARFLFIHVYTRHRMCPRWSKLCRSHLNSLATSFGPAEGKTASFDQSLNASKQNEIQLTLAKLAWFRMWRLNYCRIMSSCEKISDELYRLRGSPRKYTDCHETCEVFSTVSPSPDDVEYSAREKNYVGWFLIFAIFHAPHYL